MYLSGWNLNGTCICLFCPSVVFILIYEVYNNLLRSTVLTNCPNWFPDVTDSFGIDYDRSGRRTVSSVKQVDHAASPTMRATASFAVNSSSVDYVCPQCKLKSTDIDLHLEHMNACVGIDKQTCYLCFKRFCGTRDLKDHLLGKHFMFNAYKCLCGKEFRWRGAFIRHRKICSILTFTAPGQEHWQ